MKNEGMAEVRDIKSPLERLGVNLTKRTRSA